MLGRERSVGILVIFHGDIEFSEVFNNKIIKLIEKDGWYLVTMKGSHRQYKHPHKPGRVTIAGHPPHEIAPGTLNSILKQAQISIQKGGSN